MTSRARSVLVAAISGATLAVSAIVPSAATALPQGDAAAAAITRTGPVFAEYDSALDPRSVVDYWTPERMRSALPPALPEIDDGATAAPSPAEVASEDELEHRTGALGSRQVARHPHSSIGKIFFTLHGFEHVCSAAAVSSAGHWGEGSRDLVVTAGHCVNDGSGTFATHLVFVPGYSDGSAPSGVWVATILFTTNEWNSGFGMALARDVAFARVVGTGEYAGAELHDVVPALNIAFTERYPEDGLNLRVKTRMGIRYAAFGYGVLNWGGESQVRTLARVDRLDPNFSPSPRGLPSSHTGGSSGGPWLFRYAPGSHGRASNVINGVNSYAYAGVDRMYSPQFDDLIHALWTFVNTS